LLWEGGAEGKGRCREKRGTREREGREEREVKGGMGVDPAKFGRKSTLLVWRLRRH